MSIRCFPTLTRIVLLWVLGFAVAAQEPAYVVMVSFDGFRADYAERWNLPHFQEMAVRGASAAGLVPSYPSKTFPNHYTLVTSMRPGSHGLVDNAFFAPELGNRYAIGDRNAVENPAFYGGVALWQHVQSQGLRSASYFWVGSEAPLNGRYPDEYHLYDESISNEARIDGVLAWLGLPEATRPRLITLYFSLVDSAGHEYGPLADGTRISAEEADRLLGLLMDGVASTQLPVDLVVVSDHGMAAVPRSNANAIALDALQLPTDGVTIINNQTQVLIYADDTAVLEPWLASPAAESDAFTAWRRQQTPENWHYRANPHIGDVVLAARTGKVFVNSLQGRTDSDSVMGVHGYDPVGQPDLHGIFYAMGPQIRAGTRFGEVDNIEVAAFVTRLLHLPPLPTAQSDAPTLRTALED